MTEPTPRRVSLLTPRLRPQRRRLRGALAGRLAADGWRLVADDEDADVVLVNTCGFIEQAKAESVQTILAAADDADGDGPAVVAVGCMAERYGAQLAAELPEATVPGFDDYPAISERLQDILAGRPPEPRLPRPSPPAADQPDRAIRIRPAAPGHEVLGGTACSAPDPARR